MVVTKQLLYKDCALSTVVMAPTAEFLRHAVAKTKTNKWKTNTMLKNESPGLKD